MEIIISPEVLTCEICGVLTEQGLYHTSGDKMCADCLLQIASPTEGDIVITGVSKVERPIE